MQQSANTEAETELVRKGGTALVDQLVVSGTTFATGIIVGRICSREDFGLFMLAFSAVLICNGLLISLISTPYIVRRPHLSGPALERYNGNTLAYLMALCGLVSIFMALANVATMLGLGPPAARDVSAVLSVAIVAQLLREYARQMCIASLRMTDALTVDLTSGTIQISALFLLAATDRLTPSSALGAIGLASGFSALGWWRMNRRSLPVRIRRAISEFGEHWELARFTFGGGLIHTITMNLYPWIVAWASGTAAAGVWSACLAVAGLITPFVVGTGNYLAPRLAASFATGGRHSLRRLAVWTAVGYSSFALPYAGFLSLFGGVAVKLMYGEKYTGYGQLVTVLGAAILAAAAGFPFARALFSIDRADIDLFGNAFALVSLLTAGAWMTWQWGPLGTAYGMLVVNIAASSIKAAAFLRFVRPVAADATQ